MKRTNSYYGSPKHIAHCKQMGLNKRVVRDLNWFMGKVDKNGPIPEHKPELGNCWLWKGVKNIYGYGFFQIGRQKDKVKWIEKMWMANRYSWFLHFGEIPSGKWVLHKCDNPTCVRPDHLFLGTNQENQIDSHQKGFLQERGTPSACYDFQSASKASERAS